MNTSIIVATHGDIQWSQLAQTRALPSAETQGAAQVIEHHAPLDTLAGVRNTAARSAHGDWLCFLDADDELEPGYLDAMPTHSWERSPVLLVPKLRRIQEITTPSRSSAAIPNKGRWPVVNECVIGTLVHRWLFEKVGGFRANTDDGTEILMYEDWDLWLRCWDAGAKLVYTDAVYREHVSPTGRNTNAHEAQAMYDAIWADHERRVEDAVSRFASDR